MEQLLHIMQNADADFASIGNVYSHESTKMKKRLAKRLHGIITRIRCNLKKTETEKMLHNIMCPHLDNLDTEEDDESDDHHIFDTISCEDPVNFIQSMNEK